MAFKMKGYSAFTQTDKQALRKAKRKSIKNIKEDLKSGKITKEQFKDLKDEIKGYTDVDSAKDYLDKN